MLHHRKLFPALESSTYMVSHSLGAMPKATEQHMAEFLRLWVEKGIVAWDDWLPAVTGAAGRIGRLIGAPEGTVIMHQNVSTVMSVLASCLDYSGKRNKIVYSALEFPTVSYVWQAEQRRGARVVVLPGDDDGVGFSVDRMCEAIDEETLLVPLSLVLFRSSFISDAETIVRRAHEVGAMVVLDMYQAVGVVPVDVTRLGVAFACGGSVKWLCGGPGAAYLYVRPDLMTRFAPRVTGWFGHEAPFAFTMPEQRYAQNVWRYMGGTPVIAAMYQARAGAEIIGEIGVANIREKSLRQTARLIMRVDAAGFRLNSPRKDMVRGGTVVFDFPGSEAVAKKLNQRKFLCDHRPGAGVRVSPHFYTTDAECDAFMDEVVRLSQES
jgi:kynureninase